MFAYIVKRILIFIPTLIVISFLTFSLSKLAPGDPVELALGSGADQGGAGQLAEKQAGERSYLEMAEKLGMNLPVFYISLTSAAYPDSLYKIPRKQNRKALKNLIGNYGNWPLIQDYYVAVKALENNLYSINRDSSNYSAFRFIRENCIKLYSEFDEGKIDKTVAEMANQINETPSLSPLIGLSSDLVAKFNRVKSETTLSKKFIPAIHWYGLKNQYHRWISNFIRGDFGISYRDKRPVLSVLKDGIKWTMLMNFIAILIAYFISIPVGVMTAVKKDSAFDKITTTILFMLYSLPNFWIATMLIIFLTNDQYADWLNIFPTHGLGSGDLPEEAGLIAHTANLAHHLVLPILCLVYASFAFISRQMRGGLLNVIKQDYIRTARAKGVSEGKVIWRHAFRNSLIPIITMFASIFPAAISGSVVIEIIFSIPGMGMLSYGAIVARDYPIVFAVLMLAAVLTMVGILVADLLYAAVDPRISFSGKK